MTNIFVQYSEQKFNTQKPFIAEIKTFKKNSMLRFYK